MIFERVNNIEGWMMDQCAQIIPLFALSTIDRILQYKLEYLFIGSYYRQLSVDFEIKKKYKNKPVLLAPRVRANKTGISLMIFILIFVENCL